MEETCTGVNCAENEETPAEVEEVPAEDENFETVNPSAEDVVDNPEPPELTADDLVANTLQGLLSAVAGLTSLVESLSSRLDTIESANNNREAKYKGFFAPVTASREITDGGTERPSVDDILKVEKIYTN